MYPAPDQLAIRRCCVQCNRIDDRERLPWRHDTCERCGGRLEKRFARRRFAGILWKPWTWFRYVHEIDQRPLQGAFKVILPPPPPPTRPVHSPHAQSPVNGCANEDQPLFVGIEDGQLVVRIGINILAFAAERCPLLARVTAGDINTPPYARVIDKKLLAEDVLLAIAHEEEDGATPVHVLFDKAILEAYEQGSLAFGEGHADDQA